jgi:hypothetical protein
VTHKQCEGIPDINRSFEPYVYFSDLQASVEACFPGFDCILKLPDTPDIIGSQEELCFAYLEKVKEAPILNLDLQLVKTVNSKRKRIVEEDTDPNLDILVSRRTGPWKNGEVELFKAGVKVFVFLL